MNARAALLLLVLGPLPARSAARLDRSNEGLVHVCAEYHPLAGHRRTPGCSGIGVRAGRRVRMSYNAHGLRDKDYSPRPAPGTRRVLAMGGSIVAGSGLEEEESPPRALERALRRRGARAEVIDGAGEGYTGWQNVVMLPGYLDAYAPHAVVYYLPSQHLLTDLAARPLLRVERGRVLGRRPPLGFLPERWRSRRLGWLAWVYREQWHRVAAARRLAALPEEARAAALLAPTLEDLAAMRASCEAAGASFHVAFAGEEANADYYVLPGRPLWLARLAQRLLMKPFRVEGAAIAGGLRAAGLDLLDLSADRAALEDPARRIAGDYHWNAAGAEAFGEAVARELSRRQRAPSSRPTPATATAAPSAPRALTRSP